MPSRKRVHRPSSIIRYEGRHIRPSLLVPPHTPTPQSRLVVSILLPVHDITVYLNVAYASVRPAFSPSKFNCRPTQVVASLQSGMCPRAAIYDRNISLFPFRTRGRSLTAEIRRHGKSSMRSRAFRPSRPRSPSSVDSRHGRSWNLKTVLRLPRRMRQLPRASSRWSNRGWPWIPRTVTNSTRGCLRAPTQ